MANTSSAKKAIRSAERKRVVNLARKEAYKSSIRAIKKAVAAKDKKKAEAALPKAYKEIDKAAKVNILHKNTAGRYKSQLVKKVKSL